MLIKPIAAVAVAAATAFTLAGCAANETPAAGGAGTAAATTGSQTLTGIGASSQKAAQEKWVAEFQTKNSSITVNYSPDGSGAGRSAFIAGAAQFAGSDRPFKDEEMGAGKFAGCAADSSALNLPVYISPIAVIFKVDGVDELELDPAALAGIFAGKITKWNDPAIAKTNPKASLPDANITPVHRSDDSGTTNNFTDTLNKLAPTVWTAAASDTFPADFGGEAANGTSGVVEAVTNGTNTIGYADASQAGSLGKASILVNGKALQPEASAAASIVDALEGDPGPRGQRLGLLAGPDVGGCLPGGAGVLRDRVPDLQGLRPGGAGEGLRRLHRFGRRPGSGGIVGRIGGTLHRSAGQGEDRGRLHQVSHRQ